MSTEKGRDSEFHDLLEALCDSELDDNGYARLAQLLESSAEMRQEYTECVSMCMGLMCCCARSDRNFTATTQGHRFSGFVDQESEASPSPPSSLGMNGIKCSDHRPQNSQPRGSGILRGCLQQISESHWRVAAAAVLLMASCAWLAVSYRSSHERNDRAAPQVADAIASAENDDFVARIVRVSPDLEWSNPDERFDFLLRLRSNQSIRIAAGLVQVEFFSGATIILHGPAVFTSTGAASGHLEAGRLTGHVNKGNFRLKTDVAEVIDLGTEFGVSVDPVKGMDVLVFQGEVQVIAHQISSLPNEVLNMTEGMAARILTDGRADCEVQIDNRSYSRSIDEADLLDTNNQLSLVDIISGGDGTGSRLAGAIDPITGKKDQGTWRDPDGAGYRNGDGKFHSVGWNPLIDGVFVPRIPKRSTQIDSIGHVVNFPGDGGSTWGPVWARRWESLLESADRCPDFWGKTTLEFIVPRLREAKCGVVGMHANVGITLDLRAVRLQRHRCATSFKAVVANLHAIDMDLPKELDQKADFYVYVDGELRYSRTAFGGHEGDATVVVPLFPDDLRLTLVSTDGGDMIRCDDVTLIDPVLVLADLPTEPDEE